MLRQLAIRFPISAFVLVTFTLTWAIWSLIPLLAGDDWILIKVLVGVGIVPGLIAVLFDRLRHGWSDTDFTKRWWTTFGLVSITVTILVFWTLIDADGGPAIAPDAPAPPGLGIVGMIAATLSGISSGFVFATAQSSTSRYLNSISNCRIGFIWISVALLISALLYGGALGITWFVRGDLPVFPLAETRWRIWLPYLLRAFFVSWLLVTVGEETGWRGYLLPLLQQRFSPLVATLILGLIWGIWHMPLYYIGMFSYPRPPMIDVLIFTVFATLFAFQFTWMFNRTGGVLLLALLLHAGHNTTNKMFPNSPWVLLIMGGVAICLVCHERMWKKIKQAAPETRPTG